MDDDAGTSESAGDPSDTGSTTNAPTSETGSDDPLNPLANAGPVVQIGEGYTFLEGPVWRDAEQDLLFSELDGEIGIYRYDPTANDGTGATEPFIPNATFGSNGNSNGLTLDGAGNLLAAEHGRRQISRYVGDTLEVVTDRVFYDNADQRYNSPNDLVVHSNGTVYFTDPNYGGHGDDLDLDFHGVYRVPPDGDAVLIDDSLVNPNGIGLSPNGDVLYVVTTSGGTSTSGIYAYSLDAQGQPVGERQRFAEVGTVGDGMTVDDSGNVFVAFSEGVAVFAPDGTQWPGLIEVPSSSNCTLGGPDGRTLYITARSRLYQVQL